MGRRKKILKWETLPEPRRCEHPGCTLEAVHRTPQAPERMDQFSWFCLNHAREFNAGWDFFGDMGPAEIEQFWTEDVVGHRPTWPVGSGPINQAMYGRLRDHFGVFSSAGIKFTGGGSGSAPRVPEPRERRALARLDLQPDPTLVEIKNRYKKLVKRFHPDLNGGDKRSEEHLKDVNEAYAYLMTRSYT